MLEVHKGCWVTVIYEDEIFIGKVAQKLDIGCTVRCLHMPYLVAGIGSEFEKEDDTVFYKEVFEAEVVPVLKTIERKFLWTYQL